MSSQVAFFLQFNSIYIKFMQVSISSITIPQGHDLKGEKSFPSPRDNHCVQKPSPWDKTGSQTPPPGHKPGKFYECIYKL